MSFHGNGLNVSHVALESYPKGDTSSCYQVLVLQYSHPVQSDVYTTNCYAWWDAELSLSHWNVLPWSHFIGKVPSAAGWLGNKSPLSLQAALLNQICLVHKASCSFVYNSQETWSEAECHDSRWRQAPTNAHLSLPKAACQRQHRIGNPGKVLGKGFTTALRPKLKSHSEK